MALPETDAPLAELASPPQVVLTVDELSVDYILQSGAAKAVDKVSFELSQREFLAVVGESGCGKSTLLFAIARLLSPPAEVTGGKVIFRGQNMVAMTSKQLQALRWRISVGGDAVGDERAQPRHHHRRPVQGRDEGARRSGRQGDPPAQPGSAPTWSASTRSTSRVTRTSSQGVCVSGP